MVAITATNIFCSEMLVCPGMAYWRCWKQLKRLFVVMRTPSTMKFGSCSETKHPSESCTLTLVLISLLVPRGPERFLALFPQLLKQVTRTMKQVNTEIVGDPRNMESTPRLIGEDSLGNPAKERRHKLD